MRPSSRLCRSSQCLLERINLQAEVWSIPRYPRRASATQSAQFSLRYNSNTHSDSLIRYIQKLTQEASDKAPTSKEVDHHGEDLKSDTNSTSTKHITETDQRVNADKVRPDSAPSTWSCGASVLNAPELFLSPESQNMGISGNILNTNPQSTEKEKEVSFHSRHPMRSTSELTPEVDNLLSELIDLIHQHVNTPPKAVPICKIFELYDRLPFPKVCYIPRKTIRRLFVILSSQNGALIYITERYLKLIADLRANGTAIRRAEWTSAINSMSNGFSFPRKTRVQEALKVVSHMQLSGIQPDSAVLTSVLQAASRGGDSQTTRTVENEIKRRKMDNDIIIWTMRIRMAGKRGDARHIHTTFQEFCESGVAADIVFVNALLEAFLNIRQPKLAEVIYSRLRTFAKDTLEKHHYMPVRSVFVSRRKRRDLVGTPRSLALRAREIEHEFERRRIDPADLVKPDGSPNELYQEIFKVVGVKSFPYPAMFIPNRETIRLFISYHCHYTGRLDDVLYYLNEMDVFDIPLNYGTYVDLLHGFFMWHEAESAWSADRLVAVFSSVRNGVEKSDPPFPITYVVATTAIKAFGRVQGGKSAREVWELLRPWLVINENVEKRKDEKIEHLDELVSMFETGEGMSLLRANKDPRWRVYDWRTRQ